MNSLVLRSRAKSFILLSTTLMLVLFSRVGVRAQDLDDVSFGGTVADENGAVLPGATVTATLLSTKSERTATTDGEGQEVVDSTALEAVLDVEPGDDEDLDDVPPPVEDLVDELTDDEGPHPYDVEDEYRGEAPFGSPDVPEV